MAIDRPIDLSPARVEIGGALCGVDDDQVVITNPRGAALVLGPPGRGKTSCVIEPTVAVAPRSVVSSSIKWEVFYDTYGTRSSKGTCWALDVGGGVPPEAQLISWSPLTDVHDWDSARTVAHSWSAPYRSSAGDPHWVDSAADWLAILLFAIRKSPNDIAQFARWAREAKAAFDDVEDTITLHVTGNEDIDSELALSTLTAIKSIPDKELGSIASTLRRMTAVYNSARLIAPKGVPFDPNEFIHTADTVYIAAADEHQDVSAGLINALLVSIASAQKRAYNSHSASGLVTYVIDEAANVARPPLDSWVSQFGGQGIFLLAGLQDLSQAAKHWPGIDFRGLFPDLIIMPGVRDTETLRALSLIAGQFDRTKVSTSVNPTVKNTEDQVSWGYSTERADVLPPAAISDMPQGQAMHWNGAQWHYITTVPWDWPFWDTYRDHLGSPPLLRKES